MKLFLLGAFVFFNAHVFADVINLTSGGSANVGGTTVTCNTGGSVGAGKCQSINGYVYCTKDALEKCSSINGYVYCGYDCKSINGYAYCANNPGETCSSINGYAYCGANCSSINGYVYCGGVSGVAKPAIPAKPAKPN